MSDSMDSADEQCVICMEQPSDACGVDCCSHRFCSVCILDWSKVTNLCPVCRTEFRHVERGRGGHSEAVEPRQQRVRYEDTGMGAVDPFLHPFLHPFLLFQAHFDDMRETFQSFDEEFAALTAFQAQFVLRRVRVSGVRRLRRARAVSGEPLRRARRPVIRALAHLPASSVRRAPPARPRVVLSDSDDETSARSSSVVSAPSSASPTDDDVASVCFAPRAANSLALAPIDLD